MTIGMSRNHRQFGRTRGRTAPARRGFTLVELLVAVALVVLMMTMFAEIFGLATEAVSTQKGAAVNDQKVRTFTTLLQSDIDGRTFRTVMPFKPIAASQAAAFNANPELDERRGYFLLSENDPDDPTDDVLAFTIDVDQPKHGFRGAILFGKSGPASAKGSPAPIDHPENDDGVPVDLRGASTMAEVAYFLRNGNLYRSVMLIREPYAPVPTSPDDGQPSDAAGVDLFTNTELQFWKDFDYSAFRSPNPPPDDKVIFHSVSSLSNAYDVGLQFPLPSGPSVSRSLGIPHLRWGHTINGNSGNGTPDEYVGGNFIGRFLKQEMADKDFNYPGIGAASPAVTGTWNPTLGLVEPYHDEPGLPRRGDELLVPNVHEFDIQVWDDGADLPSPRWVDLGNGSGLGFYDAEDPASTYGNRFDTWHPELGSVASYRGELAGTASPDGQPGAAGVDDDGDGVIDEADGTEDGWIGTDDERPLRQIRIRVRFYDVKSGQIRQLTLTLPLTDNGGST